MVNGSPTEEFQVYKGLKQGDPLSPLLFTLVMESLHISFQRVVDAGIFKGIAIGSSLVLSHMFYADDAVFMGQWSDSNIDIIVHNIVDLAACKIGCLTLESPFSYLGSKVGALMSRIHSWNEVVDRVIARLLKWKMKTLSIGGRLTLLKSVLGSMPIYHMSIFKVPMKKKVLASKDKGGLGVSSLYELNRALLFKWVWRFFTQSSSLWTRVIKAIHGNDGKIGKKTKSAHPSIWLDIVHEMDLLEKQETCKHVNVASKLQQTSLDFSFRRGPRGGVEQEQFADLVAKVEGISLVNMRDRWIWSLEGSGEFSVASVRKLIDDKTLPEVSSKIRWIRAVPIKVNVFAWKVRLDCLPTRLNISRRGLDIESILCSMCNIAVESTRHIFFV
ncbi:RNA-directed DNA polymerase, eukaryota, reverse transcriptase zinc-binding domain protein [Tanacetum coccineum]